MKKLNVSIKDEGHPLVSVIMPVYNMDSYIQEATESILNQTFTDFEFIIIDDGSTDNTWDIILSYKDSRIVSVRNKTNIGNYHSRNRGIRIAKGKYIAVMDADDIAMPERLEKQYWYLKKNPELIALGSEFEINSKEKKNNIPLKYEDICFSLLRGFIFLHSSLMIKADALRSLKGYDIEYKYAADYNLLCLLSLTGKIENLPNPLMKYRKHEGQISQSKKTEQNECAKNICQKYQVNFINKHKSETQDTVSLAETGIPEIGLAICYYTYAANNQNCDKYKSLADETIDVIYKITTRDMPLRINGLCGLGCGILYLIKNKFLDGDVDEVLTDIDNKIITDLHEGSNHECIKDMLFYINYRILKSDKAYSRKTQVLSSLYANFIQKYSELNYDEFK